MKVWFQYNWIVREQWYQWCESIPSEELLRERTGGVGSILLTFFHIIDVEWSWIRRLQGKPDPEEDFEQYKSLEKVRALDARFREDVVEFVNNWSDEMETVPLYDKRPDGSVLVDAWGEVMRHIIAHEIHHMGQLSIWSRELGIQPVSPNWIGKGLIRPMEAVSE